MKLALLFNFLVGSAQAEVISSDRFILKILDRAVSFQDISYQLRNLKALDCIHSDALVIRYFGKKFIKELDQFISQFPKENTEVRTYLHSHENVLKHVRLFFKMLRYSEDQNRSVSTQILNLIKEGTLENKCQTSVLYKDTLKTNFKSLLEMEIYLRSRYEGQLESKKDFEIIRSSIDLFMDSLDKQFNHEYYW